MFFDIIHTKYSRDENIYLRLRLFGFTQTPNEIYPGGFSKMESVFDLVMDYAARGRLYPIFRALTVSVFTELN